MLRFIDRLTYARTNRFLTTAQARRHPVFDRAKDNHRYLNMVARQQYHARVLRRKTPPVGLFGTRATKC